MKYREAVPRAACGGQRGGAESSVCRQMDSVYDMAMVKPWCSAVLPLARAPVIITIVTANITANTKNCDQHNSSYATKPSEIKGC